MESRVEEGNARDLWEIFPAEADDFQSGEVVSSDQSSVTLGSQLSRAELNIQWCKIFQRLEMMESLIVDLHRVAIVPAVDHPVADKGEVLFAGDVGKLGISETPLQEKLERILRCIQLLLQLLLLLCRPALIFENGWWRGDTGDLRIRDSSWRVLKGIEGEFHRGRAGIDGQD